MMIDYAEALEIISNAVEPLAASERALEDLAGCATATEVISKLDVPPFANSAMDGFAVRSADTVQASEARPIEISVVGTVAAGDPPATEAVTTGAVEIMTGAPVPPGCDAIIPVEQVETTAGDDGSIRAIRIRSPAQAGRHVRMSGEDFSANHAVLSGGSAIEPHAIMAIAATGTDRLTARPAPRFSVITTGSELTMAGAPMHQGLIRDSNGPYLAAFIRRIGALPPRRAHVPDSKAQLEEAIAGSGEGTDIVLTTGGVSAGRFDMVPDAIEATGGEILFHKVRMRPGKPILFARLPNNTLLFGLPGNPISVAVGLRFFVLPAVRMLQGLPPERYNVARNLEKIEKRRGFRFFGKADAGVDAQGRLEVRLLPGQESFKISPLVQSNCWAIVGEEHESVEAGELIPIAPLYPTGFLS